MKNKVKIFGQQGRLMGLDYWRMMPHRDVKMVGSFFLLDHFPEQEVTASSNAAGSNIGKHPHRGITTVTYVIAGENEHRDSLGNHAVVHSGGLQWMKAGSGIVHDEGPTEAFLTTGGKVHMMQFWLVLDASEREDKPDYYPLHSESIQEKVIDDNGSTLRVLIGRYCSLVSEIPYKKEQFLYHLSLEANGEFYYTLPAATEVAVLMSKGEVMVNAEALEQFSIVVFDEEGQTLHIQNPTNKSVDVMLFGGEPFGESIFAQGPFVMGDAQGMQRANEDYFSGKYGTVKY